MRKRKGGRREREKVYIGGLGSQRVRGHYKERGGLKRKERRTYKIREGQGKRGEKSGRGERGKVIQKNVVFFENKEGVRVRGEEIQGMERGERRGERKREEKGRGRGGKI